MCVCCCTNECSLWLLECITGSSFISPSSGRSEELLFGNQTFEGEEGNETGADGNGAGNQPQQEEDKKHERLEKVRRKREHHLRTTSLFKANQIMMDNKNEEYKLIDQLSSHHQKQLFNGHGYNLAIHKGHVRGKPCCAAVLLLYISLI